MMNKLKVTNTRLFNDVAKVIGKYNAFVELGKVNRTLHEKFGRGLMFHRDLPAAFVGAHMPQGVEFWRDVMAGRKPKGFGE